METMLPDMSFEQITTWKNNVTNTSDCHKGMCKIHYFPSKSKKIPIAVFKWNQAEDMQNLRKPRQNDSKNSICSKTPVKSLGSWQKKNNFYVSLTGFEQATFRLNTSNQIQS